MIIKICPFSTSVSVLLPSTIQIHNDHSKPNENARYGDERTSNKSNRIGTIGAKRDLDTGILARDEKNPQECHRAAGDYGQLGAKAG